MALACRFSHSSVLLVIFSVLFTAALAEIRSTEIRSDSRSTIPFDEFGFTHSGRLNLTLAHISFSQIQPDLSRLGFYLCPRDSWAQIAQQVHDGDIQCPLQSRHIIPVFNFSLLKPDQHNFEGVSVIVSDANFFTLLFSNCVPDLKLSMDVHSVMYNFNPKTGQLDYLSAGKTSLPLIYFLFFLVYLALGAVWGYTLYRNRLTVYKIHFFMLSVVILKALNLLCEAEDKSHIKRTGSAHGWDVLFYLFSFLKGITLFTLIVLIGTGWSFLKPYLQDKEKKVLIIVIPLQVVANVAQVVIDETGPYGHNFDTWKKVFLLVDILCCCAVLFPIVWSIKNLREQIHSQYPRFLCRISQHKSTNSYSFSVPQKYRIHKTTLFASYNNLDKEQPTIPTSKVTSTQEPKTSIYEVKFQTLPSCKLGISLYPDFEYNAEGGRGTGTGVKSIGANNSDGNISVDFDLNTLYIPPLTTATTRFLGLPLPPFLRIDIAPEILQGIINQETGKVDLEFKAKFWFSVGKLYKAPPLLVGTVLTSEEAGGTIRSGKGERLDEEGKCHLVGVATVQPIDDFFMNSFLGLPTECLAKLNAIISVSLK